MDNQGVEHLPLILVTGITGYIALQLVHQLLQTEKYRIRGTVRDINRKQLIGPLSKLHPNFRTHVQLYQIQLDDTENWPKCMEGVNFVLHVASPVQLTVPIKKGEKSIIEDCLSGTQRILDAAVNQEGCQGFIATSSIAAMINGNLKPGNNFITQDYWSMDGKGFAYDQSKLSQGRIIQNYMKEKISDDRRKSFKYCTINPGLVWGPSRGVRVNQSIEWIQKIMLNKHKGVPKVAIPYCDVRDVAQIHIKAMEQIQKVDGRRIIVVESSQMFGEVVRYLYNQFRRFGYNFSRRGISYCLISMVAWCNNQAKYIKNYWNKFMSFDDSARKQLGHDVMIRCQESVIDTAYWLIKNQYVPNKIPNEDQIMKA